MVALSPRSEAVNGALARVTASSAFQPSKRAREFLQYVVQRALTGELGDLKERSIGYAVFGRAPDYDTGADAVVRVTANDVRKRLMRYYQEAEADDGVRFELPAGSYVPEIRLVEICSIESAAIPPVAPVLARTSAWRAAAIAGWAATLLMALVWSGSTLASHWSAPQHATRRVPWPAMFDGARTPMLVMADSSMGILRDLKMFPVSLEQYAYRRFLEPPSGLSARLSDSWRLLAEKRLTSIADARIAAEFAKLGASAGRSVAIRPARDLQLNDFGRGDNIMLLGSAASNPWVELFQDQLDFQIRLDSERPHQEVQIRHPRPQEPSGVLSSVSTGNTGESYASLAFVKGLGGSGHVLIAQGTSMEGTDVAGELAFNPDDLGGILARCGVSVANPGKHFEVLLRVSATAGSARAHQLLAVHCQHD